MVWHNNKFVQGKFTRVAVSKQCGQQEISSFRSFEQVLVHAGRSSDEVSFRHRNVAGRGRLALKLHFNADLKVRTTRSRYFCSKFIAAMCWYSFQRSLTFSCACLSNFL